MRPALRRIGMGRTQSACPKGLVAPLAPLAATFMAARAAQRAKAAGAALRSSWQQGLAQTAHQALVPRIEWIPVQFKALPEVIHDHIVVLRQLDDREAIVKSLNYPTVRIRTLDVKPAYAMPRLRARFIQEVCEKSAYGSPAAAIEQEVAERHQRIAAMAAETNAAASAAAGGRSDARRSRRSKQAEPPGAGEAAAPEPPPFDAPKWTTS